MNFFKDKELALRFKNNAVSSKERFWYFMINNILMILILSLPAENMYLASIRGLSVIIGTNYML